MESRDQILPGPSLAQLLYQKALGSRLLRDRHGFSLWPVQRANQLRNPCYPAKSFKFEHAALALGYTVQQIVANLNCGYFEGSTFFIHQDFFKRLAREASTPLLNLQAMQPLPPHPSKKGKTNLPLFYVLKVLQKRYWCTKHAYAF